MRRVECGAGTASSRGCHIPTLMNVFVACSWSRKWEDFPQEPGLFSDARSSSVGRCIGCVCCSFLQQRAGQRLLTALGCVSVGLAYRTPPASWWNGARSELRVISRAAPLPPSCGPACSPFFHFIAGEVPLISHPNLSAEALPSRVCVSVLSCWGMTSLDLRDCGHW